MKRLLGEVPGPEPEARLDRASLEMEIEKLKAQAVREAVSIIRILALAESRKGALAGLAKARKKRWSGRGEQIARAKLLFKQRLAEGWTRKEARDLVEEEIPNVKRHLKA